MPKITFMGAGSTVFVRHVIGDCMCEESLRDSHVALYDINAERLKESEFILSRMNEKFNDNRLKITTHLGVRSRKTALRNADFVINAIQVGGYEPSTVIDFEIPKKYGLRQTIADTLGIGGIFRALRTIPVMLDFARDIEEVAPDAWFLNYTNPMAILTGAMLLGTGVKTVGLCHSVQVCVSSLLKTLDMEHSDERLTNIRSKIAGINHMAWLLEISENGKDLYPELINDWNIPLDEYPRRCINQIKRWKDEYAKLQQDTESLELKKSHEYGSGIMRAIWTDTPFRIGGNVLNNGFITNLPSNAVVEVPCLVDGSGIHGTYIGELPTQCAAMNMTNINVQLLTVEAALTLKKDHIYQAAMLDPHTAAELSIDDIVKMCDELIMAHGNMLPKYI